jgi:hypothetical protein
MPRPATPRPATPRPATPRLRFHAMPCRAELGRATPRPACDSMPCLKESRGLLQRSIGQGQCLLHLLEQGAALSIAM